jgi:vancomycin permeability regulator SanA
VEYLTYHRRGSLTGSSAARQSIISTTSFESRRRRAVKRFLLLVTLAGQPLAYKILTEARYEGQGLTPVYLRFTTIGDILSVLFLAGLIVSILLAIVRPERISLARTIVACCFTGVLLWLDMGVRRTEASEFEPAAAVALLLSICALLSVLLTRSKPLTRTLRRVSRIARNAVAIFVLLSTFAFFYAFFFPTYSGTEEITDFNADAGVVLGAAVWSGRGLGDRPSPALKERIDVGYDLLTKAAIPRLVVTGASAPGELAEAEVAKKDLVKRGIDPSQIIEETNSHTTLDQVRYIHDYLEGRQNWSRFVIISDQYHLARVVEMCHFNGVHAIGSPSRIRQPVLDLLYYRIRESVALVEYWLLGR